MPSGTWRVMILEIEIVETFQLTLFLAGMRGSVHFACQRTLPQAPSHDVCNTCTCDAKFPGHASEPGLTSPDMGDPAGTVMDHEFSALLPAGRRGGCHV